MNKKLISLLLALAPLTAPAHGLHQEPVPTVYYTPEAAYYVQPRVASEHTIVSSAPCGCCGCPLAASVPTQVLPPPPVIVRSVMPMPAQCGHAESMPMPCGHQHTAVCQHGYQVEHAEHVEPADEW